MTCTADRYLIPKELKKTTKYTDEDREKVHTLYKQKVSIHTISKIIGMSRRMVQFTLFPERAKIAKLNFAKRQKDGRYRIPTTEQSKQVQAVRVRKITMLNKLIKK